MENNIRYYNGPQSKQMDFIYDRLTEHIDVSLCNDWPIISLHLARLVKDMRMIPTKCTCWRCMGLKEDPYKDDDET